MATWRRMGHPIVRAISAVDLHLNQMDTCGLNRGSPIASKSAPLIARVITVEIKPTENASGASHRDPMATILMHFIMLIDVVLSRASIGDPTDRS